ncbi:MAG: hypothetical protein JRC87_09375 [Deltaproteobacteria bacterium]|nr:hypothetical protein [Deltaproteobacteria bacterium]
MHREPAKYSVAIIFAFWILSTIVFSTAKAQDSVTYQINDIRTALSNNAISYTILGASAPAYTVSERFSPFRAVIDIAGGVFADSVSQPAKMLPANDFSTLSLSEMKDQEPAILRFEFVINESHGYSVTRKGNNLKVKITPAADKTSASGLAPQKKGLHGFQVATTPNTTTILIASDSAIEDYTVDKVSGSSNRHPRMFIDIADVDISELVREKHIGTSVEKIRVAPKGNGARIVFDSKSDKLFRYTVAPSPQGLSVVIDESAGTKAGKQNKTSDATLDSLISSSEKQIKAQTSRKKPAGMDKGTKQPSISDKFSFAGYNKQRISVDFYKIDIHNVFRLFRQITDLNIIVDEGVSGSLTLALTDVPWDFALEVILNLMDLKKEERFNTLVIYPNKKEFAWPTRTEDNLSFEADNKIIEQESLVVEQAANQPKEIMQAKGFMVKAQNLIKRNEYEDAAILYTKSSELWPNNTKLLNRLSTLYLVQLGMNAKAVYYANKSLKLDPKNCSAALYAAIGSANMQRIADASDFFAQSISCSPPMKEALISYAAFSENNGQNNAALKLLDKYKSLYGETVNTMIAKARVLDKLDRKDEAKKQYLALLGSGFKLRPDLKKYIDSRIAVQN